MSDRVLTETVRADVLGMGMDLVGFGPVERWRNAPYLLSPQAILPAAKTVVVVGAIHITDTWTEMGGEPEAQDRSPGGWMDQNSLMDRVAYRVARRLHDHGHQAIAVASSNIWRYRQYEGIPSLFAPDLSHIHAATAAGLAEIGWSGLAITPEFGSRCRFISIVTSANLTPTPMYDGPPLCDNTRSEISDGEITIATLAEACKAKDPIMKSRTCILETYLKHCPAPRVSVRTAE